MGFLYYIHSHRYISALCVSLFHNPISIPKTRQCVTLCVPANMPYDERYLSTPCSYVYSVFYFDSFFAFYFAYEHTRPNTHARTHTHKCLIYAIEIGYSAWQRNDSISSIETYINKFLSLFSNFCSFISVFCAFWTGLSGCWRRSAGAITATAILMLLTCLLAAGAMGLWHTVEFFEKEKVVGEEFYQQWTNILRDNTRISYDWSYILAWAGVASSLIAAILLSGAAVCLRSEREKEEQLNLQYLMPGKWHSSPLSSSVSCHAMRRRGMY